MKLAILCVDDEKIVLDSLQQQLQKHFGPTYAYEIAESVDEAWEVINELTDDGYKFIVVISDWLMPMTKGDKFLIDLHKRFPEAATILLTGQADESAVNNAKEHANLHAYIRKPWRAEELIKIIQAAIDASK